MEALTRPTLQEDFGLLCTYIQPLFGDRAVDFYRDYHQFVGQIDWTKSVSTKCRLPEPSPSHQGIPASAKALQQRHSNSESYRVGAVQKLGFDFLGLTPLLIVSSKLMLLVLRPLHVRAQ